MQHSSSATTLKVKLHKLPPSVASAASEHPLGINQHTLKPKEFMCIFYLSDDHYPIDQPSTSKYYVDNRHWDSPTGLKQVLKHYILSFEQLFCDSNVASNGLHPILAIPNRTHRGLQATSSGLESVSDRQKHSESLVSGGVQGPHHPHRKQWISFHRNPPGNRRGNAHLPHISRSSSLLSQNGARSHHLRRRLFRDVMRKKVEERVAQFTAGYTLDKNRHDHQDRSDRQGVEDDAQTRTSGIEIICRSPALNFTISRPLGMGTIRFGH